MKKLLVIVFMVSWKTCFMVGDEKVCNWSSTARTFETEEAAHYYGMDIWLNNRDVEEIKVEEIPG